MEIFKHHKGMVQVRVQADDSYQIKRVIEADRALKEIRGTVPDSGNLHHSAI